MTRRSVDSFCSIPLCVGRKACLLLSLAPGSSLASTGSQLCRRPSLGLTTGGSTSRVRPADGLGRRGVARGLTQTGSHQREATSCTQGPQAGLCLGGFRGRGARLMLFPLRL